MRPHDIIAAVGVFALGAGGYLVFVRARHRPIGAVMAFAGIVLLSYGASFL